MSTLNYVITYHSSIGTNEFYCVYDSLRKAQNSVKRMLKDERGRKCFYNVTIWEGCAGGIRIETHNLRDFNQVLDADLMHEYRDF